MPSPHLITEKNPRGAGRPPGKARKPKYARFGMYADDVAGYIQKIGHKVFRGDALAFFMSIYMDEDRDINLRIEAARAAIPFERPRLAAVAIQHKVNLESLTEDQLATIEAAFRTATVDGGDTSREVTAIPEDAEVID